MFSYSVVKSPLLLSDVLSDADVRGVNYLRPILQSNIAFIASISTIFIVLEESLLSRCFAIAFLIDDTTINAVI